MKVHKAIKYGFFKDLQTIKSNFLEIFFQGPFGIFFFNRVKKFSSCTLRLLHRDFGRWILKGPWEGTFRKNIFNDIQIFKSGFFWKNVMRNLRFSKPWILKDSRHLNVYFQRWFLREPQGSSTRIFEENFFEDFKAPKNSKKYIFDVFFEDLEAI